MNAKAETILTVEEALGATANVVQFPTRRTTDPSALPLPERMGICQVKFKGVVPERGRLIAILRCLDCPREVELTWTDPLSLLTDLAEIQLAAERAFFKTPFA